MKSLVLLMGLNLFALGELPTLEFNPDLDQSQKSEFNLKLMNDEVIEFLAKNLLLDKADFIVKEMNSNLPIEDNRKTALGILNRFKLDLRSQSILKQESLELNFHKLQEMIQDHPSDTQNTPNGQKILIQTKPNQIIEVSLIRLT